MSYDSETWKLIKAEEINIKSRVFEEFYREFMELLRTRMELGDLKTT